MTSTYIFIVRSIIITPTKVVEQDKLASDVRTCTAYTTDLLIAPCFTNALASALTIIIY